MMNPIKRLRAWVRYHRAVREANEAFYNTHKRQYVIVQPDTRLVVLDRSGLKLLKKRKILGRRATVKSLEECAIYYTPYANGTEPMSLPMQEHRKKQFYSLL